MANYTKGNVVYVDTSAAFPWVRNVKSVKFIGDLNSTAEIQPLTQAGAAEASNPLWSQNGSQDVQGELLEVMDADIHIRNNTGIYVEVTNGAVVYLYIP